MRVQRLLIAAIAVLAAVASAGTASLGSAATPESEPNALLGAYHYAGGERELEEIEGSIDEVVDQMNILIRGIARRRIKGPNLPANRLTLGLSNGQIRISRAGQPDIAAPADGTAVKWRNPENGNELTVIHRLGADGVLLQKLVGDRGTSTSQFELASDAVRLTVRTVIRADQLAAPIRFSATYQRAK